MAQSRPGPYVAQGPLSSAAPVVTVQHVQGSDPSDAAPTSAKDRGNIKGLRVTGMIQIVLGLSIVFFGILRIVLHVPLYFVGSPVWGGILFVVLPGLVGVAAACRRDRCTITAYMVLAILGSLTTVVILTFAAISASWDGARHFCHHSAIPQYETCLSSQGARVTVNVFVCLLAGVDGVVAIVGAAMSCGALCCSSGESQTDTVVYYTGPQMAAPQPGNLASAGQPPQYEVALQDPMVKAQGAAAAPPIETKDAYKHEFEQLYPLPVKSAYPEDRIPDTAI
ncbi:membrane-spanning 4-domains subfamily A member 4A-like [Acanthaster planci]|uniref:Membrane-spanning 4-domains subfamily A member 4A-like n=1 Tax=Acanthaster planci TaxID=133434 RepID=A0A8B7XE89_ACAPL|nr:membrane-spanning 4-domains subfamily A member 4A-like [Acanthaster planci]